MWYVYHKHTSGIHGKYYLELDAKKKLRKLSRIYHAGNSPYAIEEIEEGMPDKQVRMWLMLKRPA